MKKSMLFFCLIVTVSCAHHRGPASVNGNSVAYDSMALGNVTASASKRIEDQQVCFDIALTAKNIKQDEVQVSNWTVAWVDQKEQYHLLPLNQRQPASHPQGGAVVAPYGAYTEYSNSFTACAPHSDLKDVKTLVLTPKEMPYGKKDGMKLTWND